MDITLQQIGKRLYERRKQLRMTQDELAERVGITSQTISTAELGKKAMRADTIYCSAMCPPRTCPSSPKRPPSSQLVNTATWRT